MLPLASRFCFLLMHGLFLSAHNTHTPDSHMTDILHLWKPLFRGTFFMSPTLIMSSEAAIRPQLDSSFMAV